MGLLILDSTMLQYGGLQAFTVKVKIVNILGSAGHIGSVISSQLCCMEEPMLNM